MNKTCIAMIDPVGGKAGMDFYDSSLLKNIVLQGYQAILFSNVVITSPGVKAFESFNNIGVNKLKAIFNNFSCFLKALHYCKREKVTWLLLHLFRGGLFDLVTIGYARLMGFRVILLIHDVQSLDSLVMPVTRKIILNHFTHTKVVHNKFSRDELSKIIKAKSMGNVRIIPHGNFTELGDGRPASLRAVGDFIPVPGVRYLLFFGQVKKSKGLDILLNAMTLGGHAYHLIMAGRDRDDSFETYRDFIRKNSLESRTIILNRFITNEERDFLFRTCEAIVLPYRRIYQSGVLLMAMSYRKPVISSDLEPVRELISHEENGLLFKEGDAQSLAEILKRSYNGGYPLKNLGENAYQTVNKSNNWQKISELYIKIFQS